jgi:hypothetical protein
MVPSAPSDAELGAYLSDHPEQFRKEDTVTFRHVFLNSARGQSLEGDAQGIAAKLVSTGDESERVPGDAFLLGEKFNGLSQSEVARTFGDGFAEKVFALEPGRWQGPVASGYGLHFVFVEGSTKGTLPPLDAVRPAVERDWANTRRVEKLEEVYRTLRQRYEISIERPPTPREAQNKAAAAMQ